MFANPLVVLPAKDCLGLSGSANKGALHVCDHVALVVHFVHARCSTAHQCALLRRRDAVVELVAEGARHGCHVGKRNVDL